MKKIMIAAMLLFAVALSAQSVKPKHEIVNNIIKSTYYYDNGQVRQTGFYKNGKVHGAWVSYNENGTKQAMGEYNEGKKVGKWFFWNNNTLSEVDYNNSQIQDVKTWSRSAVAVNK